MSDKTLVVLYGAGAAGQVIARIDRLIPVPPIGSAFTIEEEQDTTIMSTFYSLNPKTGDLTLQINVR